MAQGHNMFIEAPGGSIVSTVTGNEVVRINVEELTLDDALRVRDAVMAALAAEFAKKG